MQLSPLQSRLAASFIASCLLLALYFTLFSPHFAVAAEPKETFPLFLDDADIHVDLAESSSRDKTYEPEFLAFDKSIIGRAAADGTETLTNKEAKSVEIGEGATKIFKFEIPGLPARETADRQFELRDVHPPPQERDIDGHVTERDIILDASEEAPELAKRQTSRTVFISANTCNQPMRVEGSKTTLDPPQLTLFVSKSPSNQSPGPSANLATQDIISFNDGAVMHSLSVSNQLYIGVYAPNVSAEFFGTYMFEVAVSTDDFVHSYSTEPEKNLIFVDSDSHGALLYTPSLTDSPDPEAQARAMSTRPFVMFAQNKDDRSINGLRFSYCGLKNYAQVAAIKNGQLTQMVTTAMTNRGPGNFPKQQFYFSGLNASSNYTGILARSGSSGSQVGSGGHVFRATEFKTKSETGNCAIIANLAFCDQVAYAVPSNPKFNTTQLGKFYDDYAATMYNNFNKSLQQIPCEAPSSQRYSLASNCTSCAAAYKEWLCSVTIPRCEDFSNQEPYLHIRAASYPFPNGTMLDAATLAAQKADHPYENISAFNSSRNPLIDEVIQPGPYKEVLPCEDLCYKLVQSCPSAMGFGCPQPGMAGFDSGYAHRAANGLTCNYQGSAHVKSSSVKPLLSWGIFSAALGSMSFVLL
ncbi:stretch-activated Ca2+-permeable channel component-domain-containing protein [Podospora didyma]|uniref:Stretch-activated Ca2+-permeable channel component-domain-containing protein n=1 Tax=Podospora didyma TaxID=330526 RepID=A0AAE0KL04_9PEZI|nr:stretch-activated Ca2+-permeable channel component-domain-containing protein [Podospora didyma]